MIADVRRFPFARFLEEHWHVVREEADRISLEDYESWPVRAAYRGSWRLFCLHSADPDWLYAAHGERNAPRCPGTMDLLGRIDGLLVGGFSVLLPGTHIFPHRDLVTVDCIRCHLALRTDGTAGMRFGSAEHRYVPGRCLAFDGRVEHEAANDGKEPRIVLLVDVRRECLASPVGRRAAAPGA